MRKLAALIIAICVVFSLSGCQLAPADVSNLIRPPKLAGEQQSIQLSLEKYIGSSKYTLKYPVRGRYRSAIILHDLDGDRVDEAIVLYAFQSSNAGAHIMILKEISGAWEKEADISGDGNDIEQIEFGSYGKDKIQYLTVGWTEFTSTEFAVNVYQITRRGSSKMYSGVYTEMDVLDINGDNQDELLILKLNSMAKASEARLVGLQEGRFREVDHAPLDNSVISYAGLYPVTFKDGSKGIYIDGYKSAHTMVTELLYYNGGRLYSPFYERANGAVTSTLRNISIACRDIDSDSNVEIPFPVEMPGYAEMVDPSRKIWQINWCRYDSTAQKNVGFVPVVSCVWNFSDGYYFIIPDSWEKDGQVSNVTVESLPSEKTWIFHVWNGSTEFSGRILFQVTVYTDQQWEHLTDRAGLNRVIEKDGNIYAVKMGTPLGSNDKLYVPLTEIEKRLKLYS